MPGTVKDLIKKLDGLEEYVSRTVDFAIIENDDDILDLNKAQMLVAGIDSQGNQLGEYTPFSAKARKRKGLQTDYIDLRFTGNFQDRMKLKRTGKNKFEMNSDDEKWEVKLSPRWPEAIGLTDDNEERLTGLIIKVLDTNLDKYFDVGTVKRPVNVR